MVQNMISQIGSFVKSFLAKSTAKVTPTTLFEAFSKTILQLSKGRQVKRGIKSL